MKKRNYEKPKMEQFVLRTENLCLTTSSDIEDGVDFDEFEL